VSFFETIHEEAARQQLRFVVIGGLAVNHYGYTRETGDLDFLISKIDQARWLEMLLGFGYTIFQNGESFIQLSQPEDNAWPVDLMLVEEKTFAVIFHDRKDSNLYGINTFVPSLEHLLALKLHALKNTRINRFLRDYLDVENLARINKVDIQSKNIRELFLKYGTLDLYEKISRALIEQ
jgi:hypothetical protein